MAKNLPDLNENFDTIGSFFDRVNDMIGILRSEVVTANASAGVTGSALNPVNAEIFGSISANTIAADGFSANSSVLTISTAVEVNGTLGAAGQVLTSNGTASFWADAATGSGTVSRINTGPGLTGGPVTTVGSIQVRANTGIIANTSGLFADPAYINSVVNVSGNATQLQGRTWEAPGSIGSTTANTGTFTTLSATGAIRFGTDTLVSTSGVISPGLIDATTPPTGTTGGLTLRARSNNTLASIQVTNNSGSTEWSRVDITPDLWRFSDDIEVQGNRIGYRGIPQRIVNSNTQIETNQWAGEHIYKTTSNQINLTVPDNSNVPCPIGTAITIVNDSVSGNINLQESGSTVLQLAGVINTGDRVIGPGGMATMLKVQNNKWIVSGPGVV